MDLYTEKLTTGAADLYEYEAPERLPEIIASFRGHGAALSDFLDTHGYAGADTPEAKAAYLKAKFAAAGIEPSRARYALKWLTEPKGFERETGFRIAFALGLGIEETNEFFRTVMLDRSFDCHTIREAVYYYCICHGRGYPTAEKLINAAPRPKKSAVPDTGDVLYTKNIIDFLRSCTDDEMLLKYFTGNLDRFGYNQVRVKEYIRRLWESISAPGGLAAEERRCFFEEDRAPDPHASDSTWEIYLQILGLDSEDVRRVDTDRTIRPILNNKTFMHQFAADNFPNRQSIEKILRGESTQNDLIRKTLILFVFYRFWMNRALSQITIHTYEAGPDDGERCLTELDQYLLDAGFPEMYAGNPFDWIFIWAAGREAPMKAFRSYWQLLSAEYSESGV